MIWQLFVPRANFAYLPDLGIMNFRHRVHCYLHDNETRASAAASLAFFNDRDYHDFLFFFVTTLVVTVLVISILLVCLLRPSKPKSV